MFAHSLSDRPPPEWEPLPDHLAAAAARAAGFAAVFGWGEAARVAGLLHDIGKASALFQAYIARPRAEAGGPKGPDHSSAGAREAARAFPGPVGRMLAGIIAGHHAGLQDDGDIARRLSPEQHRIEPYPDWRRQTGALPAMRALTPARPLQRGAHAGFSEAFLTRMLFSCLVDADYLETEAFHDRAEGRATSRGGHADIATLRDRLRGFMAGIDGKGEDAVSRLRSRVLAAAIAKAEAAPGLFTLTVPTGGGKTLASLSFALEHAARHGLRRVIHVAPFTSIIEQTAGVFRAALGTEEDVLEHHANFDWPPEDEAAEGRDGLRKLRRAAENWDVPVVVTTAVQFFESLFANRTSRCRKLHNLAQSVIVLDEAQALPIHLLRPCMAAIEELARNYGASIVLCTATQPALRVMDGFKGGFDIGEDREIAPDPQALYAALKRVRVEVLPEKVADAMVAARFAEQPQMLCIVNSRAHARELFEAIRDLPGAIHLNTLMVPKHRRQVLEAVRRRVKAGEPARIVSTSLIEAGVDLDVPEVWRAAAGLDSIAQAAGRCNRNGRLPMGRTVVFEPAEAKPPRALEAFWQAARPVLRNHDDLLGLDAVRAYFQELYWQHERKDEDALDLTMVGDHLGVMPAIAECATGRGFPFRSLAEGFRLIDEAMEPVVVPWDAEAVRLLREVGAAERPPAGHLRRLQPYTVSIPREARREWLRLGALTAVHSTLGDGLLRLENMVLYKPETGLDLHGLGLRSAESNLF
ncbi:MAG TPA: CRISPR-associated endonuclease Cas3'' [Roseomonas sp.]|jgi:CRISPR-associated endonuclease/helicase Cas3